MTAVVATSVPVGGAVLTAHPLQRIGAHALAALSGVDSPAGVLDAELERAAQQMMVDAAEAATRDTKAPDGFWLKCSLSFFPNSPMNHPSNGKKAQSTVRAAIESWRARPDAARAPGVPCVLCGRPAVGFYGKVDVPLAESDQYRNSTPRGHAGMAICWPCLCCFHALPYGSQLTGGPARALHSWDDDFLNWSVRTQVRRNRQEILVGRRAPRQPLAAEVLALEALRKYDDELVAGVELLVYSNNNRGQTLDVHVLDQPLAEWLRRSVRLPERRTGYRALLRAHRTANRAGVVALARNAFRAPGAVVTTAGRYLGQCAAAGRLPENTGPLVALMMSYVDEVMGMDQKVLSEITATADRVGELLSQRSAGEFNKFRSAFRRSALLRSWLRREAVNWTLQHHQGDGGVADPLVSTRAYELLFDPGFDGQAWFHRELFFFAVLEKLHRRQWRPADADQAAKELADEDEAPEDREYLDGEEDR
ncbi:hypothetical protein ACN28C_25205 [Plantactinospora sp. WMMC1484]|uniref:hypothetical protein n=1 Tax=Plantactinospora sp. WMMC1484 TaxID=3404122 RepID=UPI003BF48869